MIITKDTTLFYANKYAGGKGLNLYHLSKAGFNVPRFQILSSSVFRKFIDENGVQEKIDDIVSQNKSPKEIHEAISKLIVDAQLSQEVITLAKKAYKDLDCKLIAIRSSAIGEDSAEFSFAGQLSSYLYIQTEAKAIEALKQCWASAYSERGISYRLQNKLDIKIIDVAVIFQEMIDPDVSGVTFTCDPIKGSSEVSMVNAVFGVGEGLVSGLLEADTYTVNKLSYEITEKEIADKESKMVQDVENQTCKVVALDDEQKSISSLTDDQLKNLIKETSAIERSYHFPQDIEWAIKDGQLYILQARPVTTPILNGEGTLYIWDNSNIVESYGGLTAPLTTDFARHVYHHVYVQFCEILMVSPKRIKEMDYFLRNMLGSFYGRIYYNILNWYKLTSILPGFKYNRSFMETMMGTNDSLADEIADRIKPPAFEEKFSSKVRRFMTGMKFFYFHLTAQKLVDGFMDYFYIEYEKFRHIDFNSKTPNEIIDTYYELERRFLANWKAPIINDYLCMIHFGLLKKLVSKWMPQFGDGFQNDLLCGDGNLESALPTREVIRLARIVDSDKELKDLILNTPSTDLHETLRQSSFDSFYNEIETYIDKYGFRCMSEMKLEQRDLTHNPHSLFTFIKNHLNNEIPSIEELEAREKKVRNEAETKAFGAVSGIKKLIFSWSLNHARKAVRNRENTRFCRTRVYGIVRKMFYAIGANYANRGIILKDEDIFYLTLPELLGSVEGFCTVLDFKALVELRRKEYERFLEIEPAPRFHTRGPVYWQNNHLPPEEEIDLSDVPEGCLKGIPCCAGVIEGVAKIILNPDDDLSLNGEILVTMRTDPGWVPLFPSAKALLVERGGLLSHSAIVAREMGIPTIVSVKGLTEKIKTGDKIRMNGETGLIEFLD
ncbi:phosphoenolpyruvate synthase [Halobacteriovorax sp. HLS]|uniref:phosphoenolpyruvate synthase n=1 Tax=Halobacteriovorax sp. HLS TaxID=2234000 RepID=UPI000FDB3B2F|nr:phosphoenolpyruvate synthase [Halobacteriovorax sp. HLS]